jgi:hypothetical protein
MAGVTSVRDLAAQPTPFSASRNGSPTRNCPALYAAGPAIAKLAPGQGAVTSQFLPISDVADARAKTRQLIDQSWSTHRDA